MPSRQSKLRSWVALALLGTFITPAKAATVTWTGTESLLWNTTAGNWSGGLPTGTLFVAGDDAIFNTVAASTTITLDGTIAPNSTTVTTNTAGIGYIFTGTGLTSGTLTKAGNGLLTLQTANTSTGLTVVANNTLAIGANTNLRLDSSSGNSISGNLQIGTTTAGTSMRAYVDSMQSNQIADTSVVSFQGNGSSFAFWRLRGNSETIAGLSSTYANSIIENGGSAQAIATSGTITIDTAGNNYSYSGYLRNSDSGGGAGLINIVKTGLGTQTFSGANIGYTGTTTINGGVLELINLSLNSFKSAVTINSGGTLRLTGLGVTTYQAATTINAGGTLEFNSAAPATPSSTRSSVNIPITGGGNLLKRGTGFSYVLNAVSLGGLIDIQQGVLGNDGLTSNWSANLADMNIAAGAAMDMRGDNTRVDVLSGAGTIANSYNSTDGTRIATFTVGVNNGSGTFDGTITQAAFTGSTANNAPITALTKIGTGVQTLTGSSTYSGLTSINAGTLLVSNTSGSGVGLSNVLINGGTLGGTGIIGLGVDNSNVSFGANGGTIAPGASAGILTVYGDVNFNTVGLANFAVELNGPTVGTEYDQLVVNSSFGGTDLVDLANATLQLSLGFTPTTPGQTFTIIENNTAGAITGTFNGLLDDSLFTVGSTSFTIDYNGGTGNDVVLTVASVVPEPSTYAAMFLCVSAGLYLRRRRQG